jgi:integrase
MKRPKVKVYISKYQKQEIRQGRGENVGKKIKVPKDYWMVKFKYVDREGKNRETTKRGFKTKQSADEYAESLRKDFVAPDKLTMDELFDLWYSDYKSYVDLAHNTIMWHYYNLLHLREGLGTIAVQELDLLTIIRFLDGLKENPVSNGKVLSATTVKNIRRTLNQALTFAVEHEYILKNPLQYHRQRRSTKKAVANLNTSFKAHAISQTKMIEMIEAIGNPFLKLVIALSGLMGLRRGEIRGLQWDDIDFEKKLIHIRMQLLTNHSERDLVKTASSIRTLSIPDLVMERLLAVREMQEQAKLIYGEEKFAAGYVLAHCLIPQYIGKPFSSNYFSDSFKRELKKLKFDDMRLHDLRHSFGSNLIYQKVDILSVSSMMGHSSVAVTSEVYAHEIAELRAAADERINLKIEETLQQYRSGKDDEKYPEV